MKNLIIPNFELEVPKNHLVVVFMPDSSDISGVLLPEGARKEVENVKSRPCVVALVGERTETDAITVEVGDLVYLKEEAVHSASLLGFDKDRKWKNPCIIPNYLVVAKVVGETKKATIEHYVTLVTKAEETYAQRQERLVKQSASKVTPKGNIIIE